MTESRRSVIQKIGLSAPLVMAGMGARAASAQSGRKTSVAIAGNAFHINGQPTYPGRSFRGSKVEGQLFTSRMVNCIVNDQNPETRGMWAYRDGPWDPERNTNEFIAALPLYRSHGLTSIAFNVQGGSPMGYAGTSPGIPAAIRLMAAFYRITSRGCCGCWTRSMPTAWWRCWDISMSPPRRP